MSNNNPIRQQTTYYKTKNSIYNDNNFTTNINTNKQQSTTATTTTTTTQRLKCIVLGSSSAGKTSILRRYFHGTFEHGRSSTTLGGDFYSRKIPNPLFASSSSSSSVLATRQSSLEEEEDSATTAVLSQTSSILDLGSHVSDTSGGAVGAGYDGSVSTASPKRYKCNINNNTRLTDDDDNDNNGGVGDDHNNNNFETTQTTDVRSQRSSRRKKKSKKKKTSRSSEQKKKKKKKKQRKREHRDDVPSTIPLEQQQQQQQQQQQPIPQVALQMWDTAGRERLAAPTAGKRDLTSTLGDCFFDNVDAAMLVYDATSTPSFLQLIRWHSELRERIQRKQHHTANNGGSGSDGGGTGGGGGERVGITVVANKLDRVEAAEMVLRRRERGRQGQSESVVVRRDVLGLRGKAYHGKDSHYEYSVVTSASNDNDSTSKGSSSSRQNGSGRHQKYNSGGTVETLSYGPDVVGQNSDWEGWSTDRAYLDCIKRAEDCCFPDRNMVQLWCRRNGLHFVEVSALSGTGIDYAIESTVKMALVRKKEEEEEAAGRCGMRNGTIDDNGGEGGENNGSAALNNCYEWKPRGLTLNEMYGNEGLLHRLSSCFSYLSFRRCRR